LSLELLETASSVHFQSVLSIQTSETSLLFEAIAVNETFVVVSPGDTKKLYVYDHSGRLLSVLNEGYREGATFIFPAQMFAAGEILVSTSVTGAALCIWDLRRGVLLHRFMDLFERHVHDELPEGCDVTSMLPLYRQSSVLFCTFGGYQCLWGFPGDRP
jgi:hypothetical protein